MAAQDTNRRPLVFLPRKPGEIGAELERRGVEVLSAQVLVTRVLAKGPRLLEADWVGVTSARTVEVMDALDWRIGEHTKIAAVGPITAKTLVNAGYRVDFMPQGVSTAAQMVATWPRGSGRVSIPGSQLSSPTLAHGLRERGWTVEVLPIYTVDPVAELPKSVLERWPDVDAVLVTSGSAARALNSLTSWPPQVMALGAPSAAVLQELRLSCAVASAQDPQTVAQELDLLVKDCS